MKRMLERDTKLKLLPLALLIGLVPLIVRVDMVTTEERTRDLLGLPAQYMDMFSVYKVIFIFLFTGMAFVLALICKKKPVRGWVFYGAALLYAVMIAVSTFLSEYRQVSLAGFFERYEGTPVLLSYILICLITFNMVNGREDAGFLLKAWALSAVMMGILGVFQFSGVNFFTGSVGQSLILPPDLPSHARDIGFRFDKFYIYGTLYNPNYVGSYMAMAFPFSLALFIRSSRTYRIGEGLFACLMFFTLLGCRSSAGIVGAFAACLLSAVFCADQIRRRLPGFLVLLLCLGSILFAMDYVSSGQIAREMLFFKTNMGGAISRDGIGLTTLEDIRVKGKNIQVMTSKGLLDVNFAGDRIDFRDATGRKLGIESDGGIFSVKDARFEGYRFGVDTVNLLFKMMVDEKEVLFRITGDGFRMLDSSGMEIDPALSEKWGFEGRERMGSGRGYIWSRSLPLLKDTLIWGFGPDTFAFYFPQNDVVGKMLSLSNPHIIVDKPHDLYLQIALNTGMVSLLAFLVLVAAYWLKALKGIVSQKREGRETFPQTGILAAVTGYLTAGFFNDSVVSVAPVFWVLLGTGMALSLGIYGREGKPAAQNHKRE